MAHRIEIISGIKFDDGNDPNQLLCCRPCQSAFVTFQNTHNTLLNVTDITNFNNFVGGVFNTTLIAINGSSPSFPFSVPIGGTFVAEIEFCFNAGGTIQNVPQLQVFTQEHTGDSVYLIPIVCVTMEDLVVNESIDFGNVPVNSTQTQIITIQNTTLGSIDYDINVDDCLNVTVTNFSGTIVPNGTALAQVSWTPTSFPEDLGCAIYITETSNQSECLFSLGVSGSATNYDCDPDDKICCLNVTLNTDNDYLLPYDDLCEETDVIYSSAILDKKQIVYDAKYGGGQILPGFKVYFNPFLFATSGSEFAQYNNPPSGSNPNNPPANGWYFQLMPSFLPGNAYPMQLIGGGASPLTQKNFSAFLTVIDAALGIFRVTFNFYMVSDFQSGINTTLFNNQFKFSKSRISNPTEFNNSLPSVYSEDRKILSLIFVVDPNAFAPNGFKTALIHNINYTSRFYNRGLYDDVSEFTSPTWTLSRNTGVVSQLSAFEATKVTFNITVDSNEYTGVQAIVFHMIDRSLTSSSMFLDATDSSRGEIQNLPAGTGLIDNHLILPSTFTYLGSDVWEASCYVDTTIDPTHNYMIFAVVYAQDGITVNTFRSNQYLVKRTPDYNCDCYPDIKSYWSNYFNTVDDNDYRPVGMERIQHRLKLSAGNLGDCITAWGLDEQIPDWRRVLKKVTLRIYKKVNNFPPPQSGQQYVTFFQYGKYAATQTSFGQWSSSDNFLATPLDTDTLQLEITEQRVRWEDTPFDGQVFYAKVDTYMDKLSAGANSQNYINTLGIVNSWIDEDVYFEYEFNFDFSSFFGQQFVFSIVKAFRARAISFENVNSGFPDVIQNVTFEGFSTVINNWVPLSNNITPLSYSLIRLTWEANALGWFNVFINKFPFTVAQIQDSNASPSNTGLIQYWQDPIVNSQDNAFGFWVLPNPPHSASIVLNPSEFENTSYSICAYWTERNTIDLCEWLDVHVRNGGSPQLQMVTFGNYIEISLFSASTGAFMDMSSLWSGIGAFPYVGQNLYLYYSFGIPTQQSIAFRFGQNSGAGLPDITLPAGSTAGVIPFVWPAGTVGLWRISLTGGPAISGYWKIAIGRTECDYAPWDETL